MNSTIRVLMLEDVSAEAELNEHCLRQAGFAIVSLRVETRETFVSALHEFRPEVILLDYSLPKFDGINALRLAKEMVPDTPVVVVTGTLDEETAVEFMKAGAFDYVLKDRLARLPPAFGNALDRIAQLKEKGRVDKELFQLHRAVETTGDVVFLTDPEGLFTYVNPRFTDVYGYSSDEVVGKKTPRILKSGVKGAEYYRRFWTSLLEGEAVRAEHVNRRKDGSLVTVEVSASPVSDEGGGRLAFLAVQRDVTERRQAEEDIAYLASISEQNPNFVIEVDLAGNLLYANPAARSAFPDLQNNVAENPLTADLVAVADRLSGAEQRFVERKVEVNNQVFEEQLCFLPDRNCIRIFAHDITERRRLEAQLRQAQKMEAVGQLTGGIAHDFNNVLTIIMANAGLIATMVPDGNEELRSEIAELQAATQRGATMIRKLMGFSRRDAIELSDVNLGSVVQDLTHVLRRLLPKQIEIQTDREEPLCTVRADPGAVEQILLNLATNARDAMSDNGTLRLLTKNARVDEFYQELYPWTLPGEYACVSVRDTGVGMDESTLVHIFEPFFTTKPRDSGTGLGMPMVYGLMKQHGGFVDVSSELGKGTEVNLFFPASRLVPDHHPDSAGSCLVRQNAGHETILVADDEPSIRRAAKRILEDEGYSVLVAADGEEALDVYERFDSKIDLVLADVIMPTLSGPELFENLRAQGEDVRFLLTSGYSAMEFQQSAAVPATVPFLQKPWSTAVLLRRVREVLDRGEA